MREEEIDWCVYRLIADRDTHTVSGLQDWTKFESAVVEASLERLTRAGLIARQQNEVCVLPFQGTLIYAQAREKDSPLVIENGVIRYKKPEEPSI